MITFEAVTKRYKDATVAVDSLDLTIPDAEITVLVGPSGCGKTTTLRMVNRMLEPTSGTITFDGRPLAQQRRTTLRRRMGYVLQGAGLFPHRTVLDNITTVCDLLRWPRPKSRARALELMGLVGLDRALAGRYPAQLSGGQQQRVGVARALAAEPSMLLMDEPFSAVDPVVRTDLQQMVRTLQQELGTGVLMITHDVDEAITMADRMAILAPGGRLAQWGSPADILDRPASDFVSGFVGRDRGYRALTFAGLGDLPLQRIRSVRTARGEGAVAVVVDGEGRPLGWSEPGHDRMLPLGATFRTDADSLRPVVDAALSAPLGLAVAVTPQGRLAGVVAVEQILRAVTEHRHRVAVADPEPEPVPDPDPDPADSGDASPTAPQSGETAPTEES